jgi:hypothetical protein
VMAEGGWTAVVGERVVVGERAAAIMQGQV